jgi:putative cell wall-binding protein
MRKARKSLAILLAVAMVFCMAPAMVFGAGDDGQVNRIAGNDRYITSAETALRAFESADTVLIARGDDEGGFADGLAASYLAGVENAPILLTEPNGLPPVVKDAISKLGAKKAIILGGPAVVSDKVKDDLAGLEVERIFGDDRFETAAKIAAKGKADTAFVVSGYAPADSLVAGPLAFSKNYPILLVGNNVPDFTSKALADLGIKNIYVIGGTGVVSESVYNDLAAKADQIVRYGGNDRVATSLEVAQNLYTNPVNFSIVGYDGLADAVGAAVFGNPILYTDSDLGISGIQSYLAGAVTADSNVNIFGGTGVVSNAAETALENIVPDELKVEIVSAINDINVEFGGAYELPATVEITLSDETVVEVPVTWEDTVDVKVAGTYALVGTLDLSELEDVAATDKVANVNVVVAKAVPYSLTTDADAIIDAVVGNNVSITYAVKDKNGNAVVGTDVRVRAIDTGWPGGVVEEQVLTTDENGQVTFVYTSTDGRDDDIQAVVLEKPTLRNTDVAVQWVETAAKVIVESPEAKGFIVDSATNIDAELMTIKYVATFLDEDGKPLADGKTVTVDLTGVTGVLTSGINDEFAAAAGVCTATLANGDGTAVLEFTAGIAQEIEPLFYYDIDGFGLDPEDPRAKGAKVEVVDGDTQEPTFTLELKEVDEDKNVNTDVTEVDGVLQVLEGSTVEYLLTAIDQYGNPFIGTAQLSHKNLLDDLAGNDTLHGAIVFEAADVDGAYAVATNINFDSVDVAADGIVQVQVTTGAADDYTTLVVWVDADGNLELDADEVSIESKMIEFVAVPAKVLTSMDIEADLTTVVADNFNDVEYTVELLDQDGNGLDVSGAGDSVDVVIELYKDGEKVDQSAAGASKIDSVGTLSVGTYAAAGKNVKITGINANDGKFDFTVLPAAADAGSSFYPVVYIDINNNGTIEADEIDTAVQGPAFEATALPNSYEVDLPKTKVVAGETIDVKITALDSAPATEVNFNGEHIVKIEIQDSSDATLKTYNLPFPISFNCLYRCGHIVKSNNSWAASYSFKNVCQTLHKAFQIFPLE